MTARAAVRFSARVWLGMLVLKPEAFTELVNSDAPGAALALRALEMASGNVEQARALLAEMPEHQELH